MFGPISMDTGLQVTQIILTALVAIVSPFYPNYSLFARRSESSFEKIQIERTSVDSLSVGWVERREHGFKELRKSIDNHRPLSGAPVKIGIARGEEKEDFESYIGMNMGACVLENAVFFVEYEGGDREPIIYHPFNPRETLRLNELRQWVRNTAIERGNYLTAILALIWTTVAVLNTVQ